MTALAITAFAMIAIGLLGWMLRNKSPTVVSEPWQAGAERELRQFREVGQTFKYLGREMLVIRHWQSRFGGICPALVCQYADERGEIHDITILYYMLPTLREMNPDGHE